MIGSVAEVGLVNQITKGLVCLVGHDKQIMWQYAFLKFITRSPDIVTEI